MSYIKTAVKLGENDTSSESGDSDESSFEVMFVPEEEIQQVN